MSIRERKFYSVQADFFAIFRSLKRQKRPTTVFLLIRFILLFFSLFFFNETMLHLQIRILYLYFIALLAMDSLE